MRNGLMESLIETIRAVIPIVLVVITLQVTFVALPLIDVLKFLIGTVMVILGLTLFLWGVKISLVPIGEYIGALLPQRGSLLFFLASAFIIGLVVTLAEPAVWVLAGQVETVSGGEINNLLLIIVVALGVGLFVCLAMLRILLGVSMALVLTLGYLLIFLLSPLVPPAFLPVAFDAGGVTTGPVTVPFIIALGMGAVSVLGGRNSLADGFGLVGLASIGPILAVFLLGVIFA